MCSTFRLDFAPIGPRYSNLVLQALLVLLKKQPPPVRVRFARGAARRRVDCGLCVSLQKRRLLVLATTSVYAVMDSLELVPAFSTTVHVSPLTTGAHILAVAEQTQAFSDMELAQLQRKLDGKK